MCVYFDDFSRTWRNVSVESSESFLDILGDN